MKSKKEIAKMLVDVADCECGCPFNSKDKCDFSTEDCFSNWNEWLEEKTEE